MPSPINSRRKQLPPDLRRALTAARHQLGWSQAELGQRVGLPQMHISGIETGRVVPRYDTLVELVRVLGLDLILVPRELIPVVNALIRDFSKRESGDPERSEEQPLYALDYDEES